MIETLPRLSELEPLKREEVEDALFRPRDRAWSALVGAFHDRREADGLTYEQLGARVGKSRSQIHRWISAPFNMTLASFGLLAEGLNVDFKIVLTPRPSTDWRSNYLHPSDAANRDLNRAVVIDHSEMIDAKAAATVNALRDVSRDDVAALVSDVPQATYNNTVSKELIS